MFLDVERQGSVEVDMGRMPGAHAANPVVLDGVPFTFPIVHDLLHLHRVPANHAVGEKRVRARDRPQLVNAAGALRTDASLVHDALELMH